MVWGRPFVKGHPKIGGRAQGTPNKKTVEKRLVEEQARKISSDLEPLDYMLEVMRDPTADQARRDMMAKAAAPYRHPQLQAVAHKYLNADGTPIAPSLRITIMQPPTPKPRLTSEGPIARRQHVRHRYARCCRPAGVEEHITCKRNTPEAGRSRVWPEAMLCPGLHREGEEP